MPHVGPTYITTCRVSRVCRVSSQVLAKALLYVKVKRSSSRHLWARTDWSVPQYSAGVFISSEAGLRRSWMVLDGLWQSSAVFGWVETGSGLGRDWDLGPDEG